MAVVCFRIAIEWVRLRFWDRRCLLRTCEFYWSQP